MHFFLNQLFSLCPYRHNAAFFTGKKVDIWDKTKYTVSKRKIRCQMKEIERAREFKFLSAEIYSDSTKRERKYSYPIIFL